MHGTGRTSATDISLQLNIPMVEVDLSENHYDDAVRFALPHIHTALRRCKRGFATVAWYDPHSMGHSTLLYVTQRGHTFIDPSHYTGYLRTAKDGDVDFIHRMSLDTRSTPGPAAAVDLQSGHP